MQEINLHKQKLITILIGVLGIIFLFLPWQKIPGVKSYMGFSIWGGIVCGVAIAAVIVVSLLIGDKTKPFDKQGKIIAIACFGLMLLLAFIVLIASGTQQVSNGYYVFEVKKSAGIGVWLSLFLYLIGLAWVSGILDQFVKSASAGSAKAATPPPPPPVS